MERYYSRRHVLSDVLARRILTEDEGPLLYLVLAPRRREYEVVYIGQTTRAVAERLRGHVRDESLLGRRLRGNLTGWMLDVYDLPSARAMWPEELHGAADLDAAERALIERYQPALNTAGTRKGKRQARRRKQADWGFGRWLRHLLSGS